ncbi:MAG: TraK family protein [Acidobacteriota bacterium]|nr:TraK family protein [Acidobacteriota bacterium]
MSSDTKLKGRTGAAADGQEKVATSGKERPEVSLSARIQEKPRTKFGELRRLWPEIKAALRDGNKLKQVWECMVEAGIDLSWPKFRTYVTRLRRLEAAGADLPVREMSRQDVAPAGEHREQNIGKRDPLSNLRSHLNKRPGFEFDERPPDKNKLI